MLATCFVSTLNTQNHLPLSKDLSVLFCTPPVLCTHQGVPQGRRLLEGSQRTAGALPVSRECPGQGALVLEALGRGRLTLYLVGRGSRGEDGWLECLIGQPLCYRPDTNTESH